MKTLLLLSSIFISSFLFGQTWQTVYGVDVSPINTFTGSGGGGTIASKWFKINPYDNSIWMGKNDKIQVLRNDGSLELFDFTTHAILQQYGNMLEFEFTQNFTYLVDENNGLYKYDGSDWAGMYFGNGGIHICSDKDTVWMSKSNNTNYVYSFDELNFQGDQNFRRVISKNGKKWVSGSSYGNGIGTYDNGIYKLYSPDTSFLLSWINYDFKYAKKTDTLYVASDMGISLAHEYTFIDTITTGNSTNMPSGGIIEFEFDNQNNIWAVFGNSSFYPNTIAYYDQATEAWTQSYDSGNSPVNFNLRISIEVDTSGNLWVANGENLHVLKINNPPTWLEVAEKENTQKVSIYPNPAQEVLFIQTENFEIENMEVFDLNGKVIIKTSVSNYLSIENLNAGLYLLQAKSCSGEIIQRRFIKE